MERLTRSNVKVDPTAAKYMGKEVNIQGMNDRLLDLVLNGPTLNGVSKDVLRQIIRQLYNRLAYYEDMEEQGRLFVRPYQIGQVVWILRSKTSNGKNLYLREERIDRYVISENDVYMCFESGRVSVSKRNWDKTIFLTREEAENALKGGAE